MERHITIAAIGSPAHRDMIALRHRVLREPLGLGFSAEDLAAETTQLHLALWRNGIVIGTVLLIPPDARGAAKLRQMAIDPAFAGQGFGAMLLARAEQELAGLAATTINLAARQHAIGFYGRFGYTAEGPPFIEVTIPHQLMTKHPGLAGSRITSFRPATALHPRARPSDPPHPHQTRTKSRDADGTG